MKKYQEPRIAQIAEGSLTLDNSSPIGEFEEYELSEQQIVDNVDQVSRILKESLDKYEN